MRRTRPALLLVTPALLGVLALAGCSDSNDDGSEPTATDSATSQAAEEPSEVPTATTTEPDGDGDGESDEEASVDDADDFPDVVDPVQQGGSYGVVVLSDGDEAALTASQEAVAEYGFTAYTAEIGCLEGAGPALGVADGTIVSYLVFADVDAAQDFTSLYTYLDEDAPVVGAAQAKTYCVDG